jgi:hypothetical protein
MNLDLSRLGGRPGSTNELVARLNLFSSALRGQLKMLSRSRWHWVEQTLPLQLMLTRPWCHSKKLWPPAEYKLACASQEAWGGPWNELLSLVPPRC